jgi:hypothetical protein
MYTLKAIENLGVCLTLFAPSCHRTFLDVKRDKSISYFFPLVEKPFSRCFCTIIREKSEKKLGVNSASN